jgi:ketosteroid isomerase-like protein
MKKLWMVLPLALILCFMVGCEQGEQVAEVPIVDVDVDIEAIKKLSDVYGSVVSKGDVERYINLFTEDAIVMPPNNKIVVGKENVFLRAKSRFGAYKEMGLEEVTTPDEIHVFGDWAFDLGITSYKTRAA